MKTVRVTFGTILLLLALAACGGSDGTATANSAASPGEASGEAAADVNTASGADELTADGGSPLEQLLGVPINDEEAMNRYYEQLEENAQVATAECMLAQGFSFTPFRRTVTPMEASGLAEDSPEFAAQFGFGIATDFIMNELAGAPQEEENSIEAQMEGLTEGEREAYEEALFGLPSDQDANDEGIVNIDWGGGCYGESYEAAFAESPDRVFDALGNELMAVIEQYDSDPRIIDAQAGYTACMAEKGYEVETIEKLKVAMLLELGEITSNPALFSDPLPLDEQGGIGMGWNEEDAFIQIAGTTLTAEGQAQLDAQADREIEVATESSECYAAQREIEMAVQTEYEQILVDDLGDQVRAILAEE